MFSQDLVHYLNGLTKNKDFYQGRTIFEKVHQGLQNNLRKHPKERKHIAISNEA